MFILRVLQSTLSFTNLAIVTCSTFQFYHSVFGGKLTMNTFKEFQASEHPSEDNLIMHAELENENGMTLVGSDTPDRMDNRPGTNISLSLSVDNEAEFIAYFQKLSAGGTVTQPREKAPWGDSFGMCTDQFGVGWMVNISAPKS